MSYDGYNGLGKEWLKPILEMEAKEKKPSHKVEPVAKKQPDRCDKTIDMFLTMEQK